MMAEVAGILAVVLSAPEARPQVAMLSSSTPLHHHRALHPYVLTMTH